VVTPNDHIHAHSPALGAHTSAVVSRAECRTNTRSDQLPPWRTGTLEDRHSGGPALRPVRRVAVGVFGQR
jgi:hypothetical protein